MTDLKIKFHSRSVEFLSLPAFELIGTLDLSCSATLNKDSVHLHKESLKKQITANFQQKLYGQIIHAIEKAEYEIRANCFNYSLSAEEKIREAFQELRNSIPEITYD